MQRTSPARSAVSDDSPAVLKSQYLLFRYFLETEIISSSDITSLVIVYILMKL